jgi:RecA-family ATPase
MNARPGELHTSLRPDVESLVAAAVPVFPCGLDKRPLVAGGFKSATADRATVEAWWREHPDALAAVPTGATIGVDVVDLDVDKTTGELIGEASVERVGLDVAAHGYLARTRSGGAHVFFEAAGLGSTVKKLPGVDTRGDGGYVIAWDAAALVRAVEAARFGLLPTVPDTLRKALARRDERADPKPMQSPPMSAPGNREEAFARTALERNVAELADTGEGGRNAALNGIAHRMGRLIGAGWIDERVVRAALENAAWDCGLWRDDGAKACRATIRSGLESGKRDPHSPLDDRHAARHEFPTGDLGSAGERPRTLSTAAPRLTGETAAEWKEEDVPERTWLVPGLIPSRNVTLFSGDGGTGKSLLALQLAVSVAAGRPWLGREVADVGPAIFITAEDEKDEVKRRTANIIKPLELRFRDLPGLHVDSLAGEDALLAVETRDGGLAATPLFAELETMAARISPRLIVLDTSADIFGANENDRAKVRGFVGMLRRVALVNDCAVVLLSHPSLTGMSSGSGISGSTSWNNSVRSRLYLAREIADGHEPDPDVRTLSNKKAQYARQGETIRLRYRAGTFVPTSSASDEQQGSRTRHAFLRLLAEFTEQGRTVNAAAGPNYAPAQFASHPGAEGVTKQAFKTAMNELFREGRIENRTRRENGRDVRFVAIVDLDSEDAQ